jgi:hypothetical protein
MQQAILLAGFKTKNDRYDSQTLGDWSRLRRLPQAKLLSRYIVSI